MDGSHVNGSLKRWLRGLANWRFYTEMDSMNFADLLAVKRNRACRYFLDHTDCDYILMLDADIVPAEDTAKILDADGDVVSCPYLGSNGKPAHGGFAAGNTAAGCLRISRRALETIPEPWFEMKTSADGQKWALCECGYFTAKAKHYGFNPLKVGTVDHMLSVKASLFQKDGETKTQLTFGQSTGGFQHG